MFRDRLRFPRALLLIPIGTIAVWVCNALRLTVLIAIGTWISEDVAMGGFHSYSGSLLFSGRRARDRVSAARRSSFFSLLDAADRADATPGDPQRDGRLSRAVPRDRRDADVAGAISTGGGFDVLYPVRVAARRWRRSSYFRRVYQSASAGPAPGRRSLMGVVVFVIWMALEPTPDADEASGLRRRAREATAARGDALARRRASSAPS